MSNHILSIRHDGNRFLVENHIGGWGCLTFLLVTP
jgi:hypothetical protein